MRTTLTIDDHLARELKELAHRSGKPFKAVVNETLRNGLCARHAQGPPKPFKLETVNLGFYPGVNIDKVLQLADEIEDEEILRKMELRK
ncbi:MAG: DUF2191 domain-containing protein [Thermoanaerobaculia bacterium]